MCIANYLKPNSRWAGILRVDNGWGPKEQVREWATTCSKTVLEPKIDLDEASFMRSFAHIANLTGTDLPTESVQVDNPHYRISIYTEEILALGTYLNNLTAQGHTVECELTQKPGRGETIGEDLVRLLFSNKERILRVDISYADWVPVFNSEYPETVLIWED